MTDLLTRVSRPGLPQPPTRPLSVNAAIAGLASALAGLLGFMAVGIVFWFLNGSGSTSDTGEALRAGSVAWLLGHGAHLGVGSVTYTAVPLGLTGLLGWIGFRGARWATTRTKPVDDKDLYSALGIFVSGYVVVSVVCAVLAGSEAVSINPAYVFLGSLVLSGTSGTLGLLTGAERWPWLRTSLPKQVWPVVRSMLTIVTLLLAASALLVAVSLGMDFSAAVTLLDNLDVTVSGVTGLLVLSILLLPNAVIFAAAYLLGPGFSVGADTAVSPTVAQIGQLPAFPLLSALPDNGPTSALTVALMAVPPILAAVAVALIQRRHPVLAWDLAALRGIGSGVGAAVLIGLLGQFSGGALGDGRLAQVGPSVGELLVTGALSLGMGGLIGALAMTWWQRRTGVSEPERVDPADEQTIRLPLGGRAD